MSMSNDNYTPAAPHGPERKGPPARPPFPPHRMDTSSIPRKWLDLAYGHKSASQRLDIYLPDQGDGLFPVIVAIHGGAFRGGDKGDMQIAPLLSGLRHGYALVSINYRLSGEAIFPAQIQDCKSAVRFLRANAAQYHLDPDRIAVWGASAGAHLAALLATSPTDRALDDPEADFHISCEVQAVVIWSGPTENFIKMDQEFRQSGHGTPDHSAADLPELQLMGRQIIQIPELVRLASPMTYITRDIPPFLIQHGELDHIVPVEQSIEFAAAITRVVGPARATLDVLPGVYHHGDPAFETEENIQRMFLYLTQNLLPGRARPAPSHSPVENDPSFKPVIDAFQHLEFTDPHTGISLHYNLFIPPDYDPGKSYPLVLFIHDAGLVSTHPRTTLTHALGSVIWATPADQARHACFVLAPQYSTGIVNDRSEATPELDATVELVKAIASQYGLDPRRLYTTGQSMGCMASIEMLIKYPDLFAAALLVAGQWDAARMSVLTRANMWIVVSEGDRKAFPGMNASIAALEAAGAKISRAAWNGQASAAEFASNVRQMIAEGNNIKYTVFVDGTVVPQFLPDDGLNNHIYTWPVAYSIEGLRDWLFSQVKR